MLNGIEKEIADWFVENYPKDRDSLREQFSNLHVTEREFTSGGGVFISFSVDVDIQPIKTKPEVAQLDGPLIKSQQLEHGASVGLGITKSGHIDYFEIWAHANDYPDSCHINDYELLKKGQSLC